MPRFSTATTRSREADVVDYGADPSGLTDSTAAIHAAIAGEGRALFPAGTFLVTGLTSPKSLMGVGRSLTTLKLAPLANGVVTPLLTLTADNLEVSGITFDGNKANQPAVTFADNYTARTQRCLITATGRTHITVRNCALNNSQGVGFGVLNTSYCTIENNVGSLNNFENCYIYTDGPTNYGHVVRGNRFFNTGSGHASITANGILLSKSDGFVVEDNHVSGVERNGVKLENPSRGRIHANFFETNTLVNFGAIGWQSSCSDLVISDNTIRNFYAGIGNSAVAGHTVRNIAIVGNLIADLLGTDTSDGIAISGENSPVSDLVIAGNTIRAPGRACIGLQGYYQRVTIANNTGLGKDTEIFRGIYLGVGISGGNNTSTCKNVTVTGNCMHNGGAGSEPALRIARWVGSTDKMHNLVVTGNTFGTGGGPHACDAQPYADSNWISGVFDANVVKSSWGFSSGTQVDFVVGSNKAATA